MKLVSLRSNVVALTLLQLTNMLLPLVTLPYLTRVLGIDAFGMVVLVQAVMQYFVLLTGWGFSWSTTRKISAARDDQLQVNGIYSATWHAQCLLLAISVCLFGLAALFIPSVKQNISLYLCGFSAVVGNVLFPIWLLQGLEKMKAVVTIQVVTRVCVLPAYFIWVESPKDVAWAILLNGAASVVAGVITQYWIYRKGVVSWSPPAVKNVWSELREGGVIFFSQTWVSLYTTLTPIVLGVMVGPAAAGIYNLADKFRAAGSAALSPLSQALFPRMSYLFKHDNNNALLLLKKSTFILMACGVLGFLILFFGAEYIISIFGGKGFDASVVVLRWLAVVPLVVAVSNILGVQVMLPLLETRAFSRILAACGCLSLLLMVVLVLQYGVTGAAINTLLTELLVSLCMALYVLKKGGVRGMLSRAKL